MSRRGRRFGPVTGLPGRRSRRALLAVVAGVVESMVLLLVGAALLGATTAANAGARYAATDLAPEADPRPVALDGRRGRRPSAPWSGPTSPAPPARSPTRLGIPRLTGPFLLGSVGMVLRRVRDRRCSSGPTRCSRRRPSPRVAAEELDDTSWGRAVDAVSPTSRRWARPSAASRRRHAAMIAVMIMTPLHMEHGGAELRVIGVIIACTCSACSRSRRSSACATDRIGRPPVLLGGTVLLLASLVLCAALARGLVVADLHRTLPAGPGLVVRDGRGLDAGRRPAPIDVAHRRAGRLRHGDGPRRLPAPVARRGRDRGGSGATRSLTAFAAAAGGGGVAAYLAASAYGGAVARSLADPRVSA